MNLSELKIYVQRCKESFEKVKSLFSLEERKVLDKAYLVVRYKNQQAELFELNTESLGRDHSDFLANSSSKNWVLRLVRKKAWIKKQIKDFERDLVYVKRHLLNANENWVEVTDFTVELRFEQLDFDVIDKLKRLPIADRDKTNMSRASINITVKPVKEMSQ